MPPGRYFALGLSATPEGGNYEKTLVPSIGNEIYRYRLPDAARDKIVAEYALFNVAVDFTPDESGDYEELSDRIVKLTGALLRKRPDLRNLPYGAFIHALSRLRARKDGVGAAARALTAAYLCRKEIAHKAKRRIDCGVEIARRLMPDQRVIMFSERIETADILFGALNETFRGRVGRYHSNMSADEKARALGRYRNGESDIIVCCRALDEGLNVPETDAGVIVSVGNGTRQRIQRIGRVIRRGRADRLKNIYYLFVSSAAEASELLTFEYPAPDGTPSESGRVAYDLVYTEDGRLEPDPAYDALSKRVMARLAESGASGERLRNAEEQLKRGAVRTDFLLSESACLSRLERARKDERDYLITMLLMARARGLAVAGS
jgi:superfamily II DNA or RNA helicase